MTEQLSVKIKKEAKRIAGGIGRMNAKDADRYGFSANLKEIVYGEFLNPQETENRVEWILELKTGKIRPAVETKW